MKICDVVYSYEMKGISDGMKRDLEIAKKLGKPIKKFEQYPWDDKLT